MVDSSFSTPKGVCIVWFRQDLRLEDQSALVVAAAEGAVVPVYVLDDERPGGHKLGGASRWWLHHSLTSLGRDSAATGVKLVLRRGDCVEQLCAVADEVGATRVHALRHYEPWWKQAEADLAERLDLVLHDGLTLAPPDRVRTGSNGRFKIFTPYFNALLELMPPPEPQPVPELQSVTSEVASDVLENWGLLPTRPNWATGFEVWNAGEAAADARVATIAAQVSDYGVGRNMPSEAKTSRLSPYLHFGEISPATVWHRIGDTKAAEPFLRELAWRDFTLNTIDQFPDYGTEHARKSFNELPFRTGEHADRDFEAWTKGRTGYPIVDAGIREMWATGWMHNRVRMITASFLVKHLLLDWRRGERFFWDSLVDADYSNNAVNWQWIAGSGVDSNMFSRIMAPLSQSEKFDAGGYIRKWVPELAGVPDEAIHDPHGLGVAPADYAAPLIGHREARERALAAYAKTKRSLQPA